MFKKNNFIIKVIFFGIFLYIGVSCFTSAGFPVKIFLASLIMSIHINSNNMIEEFLHIEIPIFAIAFILKVIIPIVEAEWLLIIACMIYILYIYTYSKLKMHKKIFNLRIKKK